MTARHFSAGASRFAHRASYDLRVKRVTVDEMIADPVGKFVAGEAYLHFCATPTLWGVVLWGRPDETQALGLGRTLVKQMAPPCVPHVSILDASRLEGADPGAFHAAERYLTRYGEVLKSWLLRLALVRPSGVHGAVIAGAFDVLPRPYPVRVYADVPSAYAWLVAENGARDWPDDATFIAALHDEVTGTSSTVGALRAMLDAHLEGIAVAEAAKQLGLSERSLQRKLGDSGTTFQDELADARVRAAKRLLIDGDAPLTNIALDIGCASLQVFSTLFKKRVGESPSAFRKRHRPPST